MTIYERLIPNQPNNNFEPKHPICVHLDQITKNYTGNFIQQKYQCDNSRWFLAGAWKRWIESRLTTKWNCSWNTLVISFIWHETIMFNVFNNTNVLKISLISKIWPGSNWNGNGKYYSFSHRWGHAQWKCRNQVRPLRKYSRLHTKAKRSCKLYNALTFNGTIARFKVRAPLLNVIIGRFMVCFCFKKPNFAG